MGLRSPPPKDGDLVLILHGPFTGTLAEVYDTWGNNYSVYGADGRYPRSGVVTLLEAAEIINDLRNQEMLERVAKFRAREEAEDDGRQVGLEVPPSRRVR